MNASDALLQRLQAWREAGWLRALDVALVSFVARLDNTAPPSLLLGTALLAQLEGRGHSCLPVAAVAHDAAALLGWPAEALPELAAALEGWPGDAREASVAWQGSTVLQVDPTDDTGTSPLVLAGGRLYLRRYWRLESQVARQVLARSRLQAGNADWTPAQQAHARALFACLFPAAPPPAGDHAAGIDWQQVACAVALRSRLTLITGGPGTGKTYTAARVLALVQALHDAAHPAAPLRVALAAPTGKAAARLRQSIAAAVQAVQQRMPRGGEGGGTGERGEGREAREDCEDHERGLRGGGGAADDSAAARTAPNVPAGTTLHALLGTRPGTRRFTHNAANPLDVDLLFVDEASMVHLEMMAALLDALPPHARLVLLGDRDQLASVEAGAVLGDLCQPPAAYRADTVRWVQALTGQVLSEHMLPEQALTGQALPSAPGAASTATGSDLAQQTVMLRHSHRFTGPIGALALAVNRGDGEAALALLRAAPDGDVVLVQTRDAASVTNLAIDGRALAEGGHAAGYRACMELLVQGPAAAPDAHSAGGSANRHDAFEAWARAVLLQFDHCRVLCAVRDGAWGVAGLNAAIEQALSARGLLRRRSAWYVGRPVMVTRNDAALGVFNGDIGLVLQPPADAGRDGDGVGGTAEPAPLRAYFSDGQRLRSVSINRLADVETAFAMTVHKSQGSEFEHVLLVLPDHDAPVLTRELVYTGITRARQALTVVGSDATQLVTASARLTRRVSGLRGLLEGDRAP